MACFAPLRAWRGPGGTIAFNLRDGWSDRPLEIQCGQCIGCRIEKSRQWAIRCVHEAQMHDRNSFITLTYNQKNLPTNGSLNIRHWQLFAKRLRQKVGPFRFFHCGEYGDKNKRPHYHACIFGVDFSGDRQLFKEDRGNKLYQSKLLEDAWGKGFCTTGELTYESAAYVARYVLKKITGKGASSAYEKVDTDTGEVHQLQPEYITMSRRPGVGSEWFEKFSDDVYPSDEVIHMGRRFRPPRFYDEKLDDQALLLIKAKRQDRVKKRGKDLTPERLVVRERVLHAKTQLLERKI